MRKTYTQCQKACPLCGSNAIMQYTPNDQLITYCDDCGKDWIEPQRPELDIFIQVCCCKCHCTSEWWAAIVTITEDSLIADSRYIMRKTNWSIKKDEILCWSCKLTDDQQQESEDEDG